MLWHDFARVQCKRMLWCDVCMRVMPRAVCTRILVAVSMLAGHEDLSTNKILRVQQLSPSHTKLLSHYHNTTEDIA